MIVFSQLLVGESQPVVFDIDKVHGENLYHYWTNGDYDSFKTSAQCPLAPGALAKLKQFLNWDDHTRELRALAGQQSNANSANFTVSGTEVDFLDDEPVDPLSALVTTGQEQPPAPPPPERTPAGNSGGLGAAEQRAPTPATSDRSVFLNHFAKRNAKRYPNLNVHHTQLWDKVDELTAGEDYAPNEFPDVDAYLSEEVAVRYIDDSGQLKSEIMSREHVLATFEKYSAYNPASQTERL